MEITDNIIPVAYRTPDEIRAWLKSHTTPLDMVETRDGRGGQLFYYVRHQHIVKTLNDACGHNWDFEIVRERLDNEYITVLGRLTLRVGEYVITKEQYGSSEIKTNTSGKPLSIGDDFKAAASDALKKCASLIGLGLDLGLPIQAKTMRRLHAVGTKAFNGKWDEKRAYSVRIITGGQHRNKQHRPDSAHQLLDIEARLLISILEGNVEGDVAAQLASKLKP